RQLVESALAGRFAMKFVDDETAAVAALEREPFAAVLASHEIGPPLSHLVRCARHRHPEVPVIVLGTTSTVEEAVDAMRRGAADYLPPPFDAGVLRLRLQRVVEQGGDGQAEADRPKAPELPGLVGTSQAMARLYATIDKVTRYKTNILLLGESGTGK